MQLRHLRYFVGIVDAGSFSRAAESIHVAQPALSQPIAELERELGVTLFVRSARGVQPTPAGKALYNEAQQILRRTEQLSSVIRADEAEPEGTVSIGLSSSFAAYVIGPLLVATRARLPKVKLSLTATDSDSVRNAILSGRLDMGLTFEDQPSSRYDSLPLFRHRLYCVTTQHGTNDLGPISLETMAQLPLVIPHRPNVTLSVLDRVFAEARLTPNEMIEVDQFPTMIAAVRQGVGVAVLPKADRSFPSLPHENLTARLIDPPLTLTSTIVWPRRVALVPSAAGVRDVLADFLRDHLGSEPVEGIEPI